MCINTSSIYISDPIGNTLTYATTAPDNCLHLIVEDPNQISGCTDNTACNYDSSATISDDSCVYATNYYVDADDDGDGAGEPTAYCPSDVPSSGVSTNNNDLEPDCATNDTDTCGVCGGDGSTCLPETVQILLSSTEPVSGLSLIHI